MTLAQAEQLTARRQQELEAVARAVQAEMLFWLALLDPADIMGSWFDQVLPGLYLALSRGQVRAAAGASSYVAEAASLMGLDAATAWEVAPAAFGGVAADGRPLSSLLTTPALRGWHAVEQRGQSADWSVGQIRQSVLMMGSTEVADASRGASQAAMAGTRHITGYIRCISAGACKRCAVLAGRWYRWNADFLRHPRCHCYGIPAGDEHRARGRGSWRTNPHAYFNSLSRRDQDRLFGRGGAEAIRAGADIPSVVNARRTARQLRRVDMGGGTIVTATTEGTTRRGYFAHVRRHLEQIEGRKLSRLRLTPEAIFKLAADRQELIRLLGRHGYLVRPVAEIARL
ncbi:hypothetical protein ACF09J_07700 [Streptomyces sp. NPDC014889]|uniref:hypothetical protein n=1 Tax=Streptomyces sp. NPDC014889 TaxID=3364928 RepID=UPI0036FAF46F